MVKVVDQLIAKQMTFPYLFQKGLHLSTKRRQPFKPDHDAHREYYIDQQWGRQRKGDDKRFYCAQTAYIDINATDYRVQQGTAKRT